MKKKKKRGLGWRSRSVLGDKKKHNKIDFSSHIWQINWKMNFYVTYLLLTTVRSKKAFGKADLFWIQLFLKLQFNIFKFFNFERKILNHVLICDLLGAFLVCFGVAKIGGVSKSQVTENKGPFGCKFG